MRTARLRHRISIQTPVETQDVTTGEMVTEWQNHLVNIPAEIVASSVKEFIAAQSVNSEITARVVIRYRTGLTAKMRIVHNGQIYDPQGWFPDDKTGLEYLTAPCIVREGELDESEQATDTIFQDTDDSIFQDTDDAIFQDT